MDGRRGRREDGHMNNSATEKEFYSKLVALAAVPEAFSEELSTCRHHNGRPIDVWLQLLAAATRHGQPTNERPCMCVCAWGSCPPATLHLAEHTLIRNVEHARRISPMRYRLIIHLLNDNHYYRILFPVLQKQIFLVFYVAHIESPS